MNGYLDRNLKEICIPEVQPCTGHVSAQQPQDCWLIASNSSSGRWWPRYLKHNQGWVSAGVQPCHRCIPCILKVAVWAAPNADEHSRTRRRCQRAASVGHCLSVELRAARLKCLMTRVWTPVGASGDLWCWMSLGHRRRCAPDKGNTRRCSLLYYQDQVLVHGEGYQKQKERENNMSQPECNV
jgi:hypothetical protein